MFVIVYNNGVPSLALKRVTRGTARISVAESALDLVIEGIYAGDAPSRTDSRHFELNAEEMRQRKE